MAKKKVKKAARKSPAARKSSSSKKVPETPEQKAEMLRFLKLAMQTEKEGIKFYTEVKRRLDDYNTKQLMDVIMEQEKEHLRIVAEVYAAEKKGGMTAAAEKAAAYKKQKPLKTPLNTMKHLEDVVKDKVTIYNLFKKAVEFEENISRLYADMARKARNAKVKQLMLKLSDEELRHRDFIQLHQDSIYNTGHWFGWDHVRLET